MRRLIDTCCPGAKFGSPGVPEHYILHLLTPMTNLVLKLGQGHDEIKVASKLKAWHTKIW